MAVLTERTRKFVMEIAKNGTSPDNAAKLVGISTNVVPVLMANPIVKREIEVSLDKQGINHKYFASKMVELCEAENSKGEPDWGARAKGLGMLKEILGYEAPKQVQQTTTVVTYEERLLMLANEEPVSNVGMITEITCQ